MRDRATEDLAKRQGSVTIPVFVNQWKALNNAGLVIEDICKKGHRVSPKEAKVWLNEAYKRLIDSGWFEE